MGNEKTIIRRRKRELFRFVVRTAWLVTSLISLAASVAQAEEKKRFDFDIPELPATVALDRYAQITNRVLLFPYDKFSVYRTNEVVGNYSAEEAVVLLVSNTGLAVKFSDKGNAIITIKALNEGLPVTNEQINSKKENKPKHKILTTFVAAMASIFSYGAAAQDPNDQPGFENEIEEVIVTATKRNQIISEVPAAISVISALEIERAHFLGMADYLNTVPGVTVQDEGVGTNQIVIRGVGVSRGEDTSVGVYLGDTLLNVLAGGTAIDIKLVDIAQIEVLRGPQGTLYGAGTMGGAVRYTPNAPDFENLEGRVSVNLSNTAKKGGFNQGYEGVLNVPLIEGQLALRLAGYWYDNSGYVENISADDPRHQFIVSTFGGEYGPRWSGDSSYKGARAILEWQPIDSFNVSLSYLLQDLEQLGAITVTDDAEAIGGKYSHSILAGSRDDGYQIQEEDVDIATLGMTWDLDWGSFVSISNWIDLTRNFGGDLSTVPSLPFPLWQYGPSLADSFTQEIRFNSNFDGPVQLLAGVYYSDEEGVWDTFAEWNGTPGLDYLIFGTSSTLELFSAHVENYISQKAIFGEVYWDITDDLTLTVGGRYFEYDRRRLQDSTGLLAGQDAEPGGSSLSDIESTESGDTYKINLAYKLNDGTNLYAVWSEGFRLGRPISPLPVSLCDSDGDGILDGTDNVPASIDSVQSDTLASFELGSKSTFLDNRLALNASIYKTDWEGLPVSIIGDCGFGVVINAGKSEIKGAEIEAAWRVTDDLRIDIMASYIDAELAEDQVTLGSAGDRLPYSSKFSWSLTAQYDFLAWNNESYFRASYASIGGFYPMIGENGREGGDYRKLDMSLGMMVRDWNISLYAINLTNEDAYASVSGSSPSTVSIAPHTRLRPRTIGLEVSYSF